MEFYTDKDPWQLATDRYPTWDDCMRYYMSRISNKVPPKSIIHDLAVGVEKIWKSGDGCPKSKSTIIYQFEKTVLPAYQKFRKGDTGGGSSKKKKKKVNDSPQVQTPARTSLRSPAPSSVDHDHDLSSSDHLDGRDQLGAGDNVQAVQGQHGHVSKRKEGKERKELWMKEHGDMLFDVFSENAMVKTLEEEMCFDSDFYEDQKDPALRKLVIETVRVRKEFVDAEKKLSAKKARKFARVLSAMGQSSVVREFCASLPETTDDNMNEKSPFKAPREAISSIARSNITTRKARKDLTDVLDSNQNILSVPSVAASFGCLANKTTQTENHSLDDIEIPSVSTRKKPSKPGASQSSLCHERYLQAGFLMCAIGNQSPSQAVLNMMIMDTEVYKQKRKLPLIMQKKYQLEMKKMKKMTASLRKSRQEDKDNDSADDSTQAQDENIVVDKITEDISESDDNTVLVETEIDLTAEVDCEGEAPPTKKIKIDHVVDFVSQTKAQQKLHLEEVLPDPRSIRRAHHKAACYLEGEIGTLMVKDGKTFLMPDGTSRAKVGKMGATLISIEGKMRALKLQSMGNEQRDNWADTIIHQLQRLSCSSSESVADIYKSICCLVSDSCKVNKGLAAVISGKLGLEWVPGQLYCLIHSVLGFQDGICRIWLNYQEEMGHDKLYPSITGFEMDVEDKGLIKQIMEMYLRLTADRWQARSWNRYEEYTIFCKERGVQNFGQELHGNRFGELEKCCAIAVYSLPTWKDFISSYPNIRNQLAIFLRDTVHLSDMCNFLWLGGALLGIHLTEPYLCMILDMNVSHNDLLVILPKLYEDLSTYPKSLAQLVEPGLPALSQAWLDPLCHDSSPYGHGISTGILQAIEQCDRYLLDKYLRDLCYQMGVVLKRQRGNAYRFGDDADSDELVTKQLSHEDLENAPTHTKDVGIEDSILTRFGAQAFKKSTDDLIIKYSQDLLGDKFEWNTSKMRKKVKEMDKIQKEFDSKQRALIDAGVLPADAILMTAENKIQRVVAQCRRSHGGPISEEHEVDDIAEKFSDDKSRKLALSLEIRYRKFTVLNIKDSNPLFKQQNLTVEQLCTNLKLLVLKTDLSMASTATMDDLAKVLTKDAGLVTEDQETEAAPPLVDSQLAGNWPPAVGEHVVVGFDDGWYVGEVTSEESDNSVDISYMMNKKVFTAHPAEHPRRFWFWPAKKEVIQTRREFILPVRPDLVIAKPPSSRRMVVFSIENAEIVDKFA